MEIEKVDQFNWILSSTAQSLAAVFALYFTVLIFSAQAASRYNPRAFKEIFIRFPAIGLVALFGVVIIFSLIALHGPTRTLAWIAIGGAATCLLLLALDFFFNLREKLIPTRYIESLLGDAKRGKRSPETVIEDLGHLAASFYASNPAIFREAVDAILVVVNKGGESKAWSTLDSLARQTIDHPTAPVKLIDAFKSLYRTTKEPVFKEVIIFSAVQIEELCDQRKLRGISAACFEIISLPFSEGDLSQEYSLYLDGLYCWQVKRIIEKYNDKKWTDIATSVVESLTRVVLGLASRDHELLAEAGKLFNSYIKEHLKERDRSFTDRVWTELITLLTYAIDKKPNLVETFNEFWVSFWRVPQAISLIREEEADKLVNVIKDGVRKCGFNKFNQLFLELKDFLKASNTMYSIQVKFKIACFIIDNLEVILESTSITKPDKNSFFIAISNVCHNMANQQSPLCLKLLKRYVKITPFIDKESDNWKESLVNVGISVLWSWKAFQSPELEEFACPYIWFVETLFWKPQYRGYQEFRTQIFQSLREEQELTKTLFSYLAEAKELIIKYGNLENEFEQAKRTLKQELPFAPKR